MCCRRCSGKSAWRVRELLDVGAGPERGFSAAAGAYNAAVDLMRRRTTRERNYGEFAKEAPQLFTASPNADEECFQNALAAALGELPPEQRAVAHLKLWEGATFERIAEMLGIPANTAASRYRYAIDKLRERLRPIYEEIQ